MVASRSGTAGIGSWGAPPFAVCLSALTTGVRLRLPNRVRVDCYLSQLAGVTQNMRTAEEIERELQRYLDEERYDNWVLHPEWRGRVDRLREELRSARGVVRIASRTRIVSP